MTSDTFRRARLLDVPLLFELLHEGALSGSFTDAHLTNEGYPRLLLGLIRGVIASKREPFLIFLRLGEEVGFVRSRTEVAPDGARRTTILLCAVRPELRGHGLGRSMIVGFIADRPADEFVAHCAKYARAMQLCLKRIGFVRQVHHPPLEQYVLRMLPRRR